MPSSSIFRPGLFEGKVFLVTGGGTGIGKAIARELALLGASVAICSRSPGHVENARAEIEAEGGRVLALICNIRHDEEVKATVQEVIERLGRLDGLVNNAGGQFFYPAEKITPKGWHAVIETNLTGTFYMAQAAMRGWMREHGGAIVNISMDMWRGFPNFAHSGAARAAVVNLTQTLALEWAQYGIRVNAVAPGIINSSGVDTYPEDIRAMIRGAALEIPARRLGTESEVASATVFLLSPGAAFISGATLRVDGAGSLYRLLGYTIPEHEVWPAFNLTAREESERHIE
jgi:citronellol/citronellal dehydrogenase